TFSQSLTVGSVGPFVANAGKNPGGYTALVDYVFDRANPIVPEDGGADPDPSDPDPSDPDPSDPDPDVTAPVISDVEVSPSASSEDVAWTTGTVSRGAVTDGCTTT